MTLFDPQGHITNEAIAALIQETLDEISRLEFAEHLSYCDACLLRYTVMLTEDVLIAPKTPIVPPVLSRIRKKVVTILFNKYTTYAAAASFSLVLWGAGVFTGNFAASTLGGGILLPPTQRPAVAQKVPGFFDAMSNALSDVLKWGGNGLIAPPSRTQQPTNETLPAQQGTTNQAATHGSNK